jgi:hypothetical protein
MSAFGFLQNLGFFRKLKPAVFHQYPAIDDDRLDVAGFGAVNELAEKVVDRLTVDGIQANQDQIRPFPRFDGSTARTES